jgi:hypothetical protein
LVLGLIQWTEPDDPTRSDVPIGTVGHWIRLFACTVLIRASIELENYDHKTEDCIYLDEDHTIIQFLESALQLGHDVSLAALRFLGWRMQYQMKRLPIDEDIGNCPYYAVAVLLLCVSLDRCDPELNHFLILVAYANGESLPISKVLAESLRSEKWKGLIHKFFLEPANLPAFLNPELQNFGKQLIEVL